MGKTSTKKPTQNNRKPAKPQTPQNRKPQAPQRKPGAK